jgi:soluble lytic murein transglycosylase
MIWVLALTLLAGDPRPAVVELQLDNQLEVALEQVEVALEQQPSSVRRLGFDYLHGHLLEALGRGLEAHDAFARAMGATPALSGYSRYRLALNQFRMDHPEVAAGLLATLLANEPPEPLIPAATRLFARSLTLGGDCRLLAGLGAWELPDEQRRTLELAAADCELRSGRPHRARPLLLALLEESLEGETARAAAERIASLTPPSRSPAEVALLLGMAFHRHREFRESALFLEVGLEDGPRTPSVTERERLLEARYSLARSYFWLRDYAAAAARFGELAADESDPEKRARALYQQGRCFELHGDWKAAAGAFRQVPEVDPTGDWTAPALLSALRVEWRGGREETAVEHLDHLRARREWRSMLQRAALFLATSEIVRSRPQQAAAWLEQIGRATGPTQVEVDYWRGRLAETQNQKLTAVRRYLSVLLADSYHPLAQDARERLAAPSMAATTREEARRLAQTGRSRDLQSVWLLLGDSDAAGEAARRRLDRNLHRDPTARVFLEMTAVPPADWPFWENPIHQPEELLLALGIVEQDSSVVQRNFPVAQVSLGLTGSRVLAHAGLIRPAMHQAEILLLRVPGSVPPALLPSIIQELLYPLAYYPTVVSQAERFGIDPFLLMAVIREESRFDPNAVSAASARGLTQFVLPTARRYDSAVGLTRIRAQDLHQPEISIALGAAYLADLAELYKRDQPMMIAAYNAGEDQARLWRSYCYSRDPAEYFSKVGFAQTREYVRKVTSSWARYRALYAPDPETVQRSDSGPWEEMTSGGSSSRGLSK